MKGLSQARNDGMKQAHGDYLIFIDSDDYIHPEMIQSLYEQIIQEDADVSSCGVMMSMLMMKAHSQLIRMIILSVILKHF